MCARLPLVPAPLDHVVKVGDDTGRDDHLAVGVEVDSPGVAGSMGKDLEFVAGRIFPLSSTRSVTYLSKSDEVT